MKHILHDVEMIGYYECGNCGEAFEKSALTDQGLYTPVECPNCEIELDVEDAE